MRQHTVGGLLFVSCFKPTVNLVAFNSSMTTIILQCNAVTTASNVLWPPQEPNHPSPLHHWHIIKEIFLSNDFESFESHLSQLKSYQWDKWPTVEGYFWGITTVQEKYSNLPSFLDLVLLPLKQKIKFNPIDRENTLPGSAEVSFSGF